MADRSGLVVLLVGGHTRRPEELLALVDRELDVLHAGVGEVAAVVASRGSDTHDHAARWAESAGVTMVSVTLPRAHIVRAAVDTVLLFPGTVRAGSEEIICLQIARQRGAHLLEVTP